MFLPKRAIALIFSMISLLLIAASGGGCEAIVPDTIPGFTCTGTDLSGCPSGSFCDGVGCTKCAKTDVCDGFDNDCNGKVDDGPLSDHDQDGFTVCGHVDPSSGKFLDVDCNDNDPNVHPGAQEVCNGIDDDCDGVIDNPDVVCPAGQVCAPATKQCLTPCTTANCLAPKSCDPKTNACVDLTAPKTKIGGTCASDETCDTGLFCAFSTLLGGIVGDSVCSKTCCISSDCDAGFVCAATGSGGRYCLDASKIGRAVPGAGAGGASCGSDGTQCRSGVCTSGKCVDTCCGDANCTNGTTCIEQSVGGHDAWACGAPGSGHQAGNSDCSSNSRCNSDLCLALCDVCGGTCIQPCCTSQNNACGNVDGTPVACIENGLGGSTDTFLSCTGNQGTGTGGIGAACTKNADCTSNNCNTALTPPTCTDSCCTDADCAGLVCRPDANGALRCVAP